MRRLIWWMDAMTLCILTGTGCYMFSVFSDLFSRAVSISCVASIASLVLLQAGNIALRHKRRIANMIEEPAREFTA